MEKLREHRGHVRRQRRLHERAIHQLHPAIARGLSDRKWHVTHAQSRMSALFDVAHRPAEATDHKIAQALFGASEVLGGIHRAEDVVVRYLRIERANQTSEAFFTNPIENLVFSELWIHNRF